MQAGCGFKTPPSGAVFAVPLPVGSESAARRLAVTSSPPPSDTGNDVMTAGGDKRSGQWVTLSKALLLQLVERICQLSFQTTTDVVTSSYHRKSADEPEVEGRPSSGARRGSDVTDENACTGGTVRAYLGDESTTSGTPTLTCDHHTPPADIQVADCATITPNDSGNSAEDTPTNDWQPTEACGSDEYQPSDRRHRQRRRTSGCRRRLQLRARRRNKIPLATSNGQVRKVNTRKGEKCARLPATRGWSSSVQLRGVRRRSRQSWMALSKDIVYGAVENQLRQSAPATTTTTTTTKSGAIWNPALFASPSEQKRHTLSRTAVTWYCGGDISPPARQTGNDVIIAAGPTSPPSVAVGSSMLSELLGFGAAAATMRLPPEVASGAPSVRQRHWSVADAAVSGRDVTPPSQRARGGGGDVTSDAAVNYCIRRASTEPSGMDSAPRRGIWRPVQVPSSCHAGVPPRSAAPARPRWIAVNKGQVCSLVDTLVSSMIASTAEQDGGQPEVMSDDDLSASSKKPILPSSEKSVVEVSSRCSVAASEPRKWKTDLLHRMRSQHT